jgi:hypothetical protein
MNKTEFWKGGKTIMVADTASVGERSGKIERKV